MQAHEASSNYQQLLPVQAVQLRNDLLQLQHLVAQGPECTGLTQQQQQQPEHAEVQAVSLEVGQQQHLGSYQSSALQFQLSQKPVSSSSEKEAAEQHQQEQQRRRRQQRTQPQHNQQRDDSHSSSSEPPVASVQAQQQLLQQQLQLRQLLRQQQQRQRQLQLQLRREPAVLTALIKRTRSWQQLQYIFNTYTTFFNPVHVSAALTHLGQIMHPVTPKTLPQQAAGFQQLLQDLASATAACVPDYGPRQLANTLWALKRLGFGDKVPRKVQLSYLNAFGAKLGGAAPQHISSVALAVGGMGWRTSSQWRQRLLLVSVIMTCHSAGGKAISKHSLGIAGRMCAAACLHKLGMQLVSAFSRLWTACAVLDKSEVAVLAALQNQLSQCSLT